MMNKIRRQEKEAKKNQTKQKEEKDREKGNEKKWTYIFPCLYNHRLKKLLVSKALHKINTYLKRWLYIMTFSIVSWSLVSCNLTESYSFIVLDRTGDIRPEFIFVTTERDIKCSDDMFKISWYIVESINRLGELETGCKTGEILKTISTRNTVSNAHKMITPAPPCFVWQSPCFALGNPKIMRIKI